MVVAFVALVLTLGCLTMIVAPAAAERAAVGASAPVYQSDGIASHMEMTTYNADGSVTKNTWLKGGAKKTETTRPDGSSTTTTTSSDGKTTVTVSTDSSGNVTVVKTP
jgi:outer membrane lipoprotein-sorting protein